MADILSKVSILSPVVAGSEAAQISFNTGDVAWSNWAITTLLGIAVFFLRRLVLQLDGQGKRLGKLENRMTAAETHQEDCSWNTGGRRPYDPLARVDEELK